MRPELKKVFDEQWERNRESMEYLAGMSESQDESGYQPPRIPGHDHDGTPVERLDWIAIHKQQSQEQE